MKLVKYLLCLVLFTVFLPKVYAVTYDVDLAVDNNSVKLGEKKEIFVSIKNIKETTDGIIACSLGIEMDKTIELNGSVRTLNNWSMTVGDFYLFDTGTPILNDTKIFVIPVKINDKGSVKLTGIKCTDGNVNIESEDKSISFSIKKESDNTGNKQEIVNKDSNCDLSNIILNDGTIEFDPSVTEYSIKVNDFDKLEVTPVLASDKSSFIIDINNSDLNKNSVVITVTSEDGNNKIYTIYVEDNDSLENKEENKKEEVNNEEKKDYSVFIFVGIIVILLLINVIRIVYNKKK